jgi:hypothetical protein
MSASDDFSSYAGSPTTPATRAVAITPSDSVDLANVTRSLYCGGSGAIALITMGGDTVTFSNVQAGQILPIRVSRVLATGTTAANLLGLR